MYYLISNNDITENNGGTYQSKSAYYSDGAYTIGALINRLEHIWCEAFIREAALFETGALNRIITVNIQMLWPFNFTLSSVQF